MLYRQNTLTDEEIENLSKSKENTLKAGPVKFIVSDVKDKIVNGKEFIELTLDGIQPHGQGRYFDSIFLTDAALWKKVLLFRCVGCEALLKSDKFDSQWLVGKTGEADLKEEYYKDKNTGEEKFKLANDKYRKAKHQLTLEEITGQTPTKSLADELGVELNDYIPF